MSQDRIYRTIREGARWFLRVALAAGFLSAVADRMGLWGPPGIENVAWGAWEPFIDYVGILNPWASDSLHATLAWVVTVAELVIAGEILVGWQLRWFAFAAGALLLIYALAMAVALGVKAPLDYSVFAAAAGAFFLAVMAEQPSKSTGHS